jgi:hypothetical protein
MTELIFNKYISTEAYKKFIEDTVKEFLDHDVDLDSLLISFTRTNSGVLQLDHKLSITGTTMYGNTVTIEQVVAIK